MTEQGARREHFLSPMPLATRSARARPPSRLRVATIQTHQRPGHHPAREAQGTRDPKLWKGFKFAVPFDYSMHQLPPALLRGRSTASIPDADIQIRVVPPPEMVANLRAGNIDGFLGPDPFNQRAVYDEGGLHPHPVQGHLERAPVLRLRRPRGDDQGSANTFAAAVPAPC